LKIGLIKLLEIGRIIDRTISPDIKHISHAIPSFLDLPQTREELRFLVSLLIPMLKTTGACSLANVEASIADRHRTITRIEIEIVVEALLVTPPLSLDVLTIGYVISTFTDDLTVSVFIELLGGVEDHLTDKRVNLSGTGVGLKISHGRYPSASVRLLKSLGVVGYEEGPALGQPLWLSFSSPTRTELTFPCCV
jgi:hypothetical protein